MCFVIFSNVESKLAQLRLKDTRKFRIRIFIYLFIRINVLVLGQLEFNTTLDGKIVKIGKVSLVKEKLIVIDCDRMLEREERTNILN